MQSIGFPVLGLRLLLHQYLVLLTLPSLVLFNTRCNFNIPFNSHSPHVSFDIYISE